MGVDLDLTACEREPIHRLGAVQPHGVLLALKPPAFEIVAMSANGSALFGVTVQELTGRALREALPALADLATPVLLAAVAAEKSALHLRSVELTSNGRPVRFDAVAHVSDGFYILELEEAVEEKSEHPGSMLQTRMGAFVSQLESALSIDALCAATAREARLISGFDRALVYRFDDEWNGAVVAEDRNETLPSYLSLRFPASDIPAQARELYRRNRIRIIPDASYTPVPIEPAGSLDLSYSVLRSVSPVHVEYMRNMGTMASMSVSIIIEGELWGLVSLHNKEPKRVSLQRRHACDLVTKIFALQIAARERAQEVERRVELGSIQARLLGFMAEEEHFLDGLTNHADDVLALAEASGAAIVSSDRCTLLGETPSKPDVMRIYDWLAAERAADEVFYTDRLSAEFQHAPPASIASGLLAISISRKFASYIFWFRPEVVRTLKWGGDPNKPVSPLPAGGGRLHPRNSFEVWKETVHGRSLPWSPAIVDAAKDLRASVLGIVLRRAEELASLSEDLQRSNKELEAFSYSVSHDLRAPFRHIVGYSELLRALEGEHMSEKGRRYIETIIESAYAAGTLVDNLLRFSQMGRAALRPMELDLNRLVEECRRKAMADAGEGRNIRWIVHPLGRVFADPVMLRLAFENLLSNAIKYTRGREEAVIEVGAGEDGGETSQRRGNQEQVFFVRDNGVGFDMAYVSKLFGVFQRLHRTEEFEGTGIGLANVRRIVERHGGRTWARGALNEGATFFIALPAIDSEGA